MQLVANVTQSPLTRQERLSLFLRRNSKSIAQIAIEMNISRSGLSKLLIADIASPERVNQLLEMGFPKDLLPEPVARKRGRKPRIQTESF